MKRTSAYVIGSLLAIVLLYAISWIATCGIVKLVTMCFGWTFSWGIATGIWLVLVFIKLFKK